MDYWTTYFFECILVISGLLPFLSVKHISIFTFQSFQKVFWLPGAKTHMFDGLLQISRCHNYWLFELVTWGKNETFRRYIEPSWENELKLLVKLNKDAYLPTDTDNQKKYPLYANVYLLAKYCLTRNMHKTQVVHMYCAVQVYCDVHILCLHFMP